MVRCGGNAELRGLERRAACGHAAPRSGGEARGSWECATARGGRHARARGKAASGHEPTPAGGSTLEARRHTGRQSAQARMLKHHASIPSPYDARQYLGENLVLTNIATGIPSIFLQNFLHTLGMTPYGPDRTSAVRLLRCGACCLLTRREATKWPHASRAQHGRHSRSRSPSSFCS